MAPPPCSILPILLLLIFLPSAAPGPPAQPCPRPCSCPQTTELHCTFRSLLEIPAGVPQHVERINLGFNRINQIRQRSLAGLKKLELFLIHGNNIHRLPDGAFQDLGALQMLKISYNKLTEISRHTLKGLWSLARLHLDHNQLEFLPPDAFHGLTSLKMLQLEGNRLQKLHPDTFATFTVMEHFPVSTVRHLYLSDNELTSISAETLRTMPQLENLYLHGNPWTCDCNMKGFYRWNQTAPGVLKCKKERALAGGQLCPACSSPTLLHRTELQSVETLVCSPPTINSPARMTPPEDDEGEVLTREDFKEPLGNVSLGLSDEHGNQVDLDCNISEPKDFLKINWDYIDPLHLVSNISLSVDVECPVVREKYERLWRLIAYYSSVPAHLQRGAVLSPNPSLTYVYTQDSERDALYYTGVKINMMALPKWLMQTSIDLQLNRLNSSPKMVQLTLSTDLSETAEVELLRRQRRTWVMIESTNVTRKGLSAIVGSRSLITCNVHSSSQPVIQWTLPDGSKLQAPYSNPDNALSVSSDGRLVINAVKHTDAGVYYCKAGVRGDFAVVKYLLTVQESSSPTPGEETSVPPIEGFVGNPIFLPCMTSGSPDAEVNWILPNSYIVHSQSNSSRALVHPNGTLHIQQTQPSDAGYYKCVAMNQHGVATLSVKVNVLRRKERKLSARPQSAFSVNTQIKLLGEDTEESSGDNQLEETPKPQQESLQRKTVIHDGQTSRNGWRRASLLRKPMGSRVTNRKNTPENRRRINVSKSKIDPERWADILAKIRDRSTNGTVTPTTGARSSKETIKDSSDGQQYFTTTQTPKHQTHVNHKDSSHSYTPHTEPHVTQHTAFITNTARSSNSRPFLLHTTSVPPHTDTFWPDSINTARIPVTTPARENTSTDGHAVNTGGSKSLMKEIEGIHKSNPAKQSYLNMNKSDQEQPENHLKEMKTTLLTPDPPSTTATPTTSPRPTRRNHHSASRNRHGNPKRRNEGRRKRPNRKKQKLSDPKHRHFPLSTEKTTATLLLNIVSLGVTAATLSTSVPPPSSRVASLASLIHENNPGYGPATKPATAPATPQTKNSHERLEKPFLKSTSAAPLFPTTSPRESHGNTQQWLLAPPLPPLPAANSSEETQKGSFSENVEPSSDSFLDDFKMTPLPQADVKKNQSAHQHKPARDQTLFPLDVLEITTPQTYLGVILSTEHFTTRSPTFRDELYDIQKQAASAEFKNVSQSVTPTPATSTISALKTASTSGKTNKQTKGLTIKDQNSDPDIRTSNPSPTEAMPEHRATSKSPVFPNMRPTTVTLTTLAVPKGVQTQSHPFTDKLLTIPEDAASTRQLPGPEPSLRGKPRIRKNYLQTLRVKAGEDAGLPCVAEGQPVPFLLWTRASTGESIAQNTRIQRFEVRSNGTLIIRAAQVPDQDRYLCTVQNQHGTDQITINLVVESQHPRILHPRHRDVTVHLGEGVGMDCKVEGRPDPPRVTWVLPTNARLTAAPPGLHSQQRVAVLTNGTLRISHALHSDRGVFKCFASNAAGADSVSLRLHVSASAPVIQQTKLENVSHPEGSNVHIHCSATGTPPPVVRWVTPAGVQLAPSQIVTGLNLFVLTNGTLFIRGLSPGNAGRYECTASNAVSSSKRTVELNAMKNPFLSKASITSSSPQRTEAVYGSKVTLNCVANGEPEPRIIWRTPSKKLVDDQYSFDPRIKVFANGTITIESVTKEDSGDFLCVARNKMGDDYMLFEVNVLTRAAKIEQKQLRSSQEVVDGGGLKVDCVASGFPNPEIRWSLPDGTMVNLHKQTDGAGGGRSRRYVMFDNGTLYYNDVGPPEEGDYTCYAENQLGKDEMKVRVKIKVAPSSPQIQDKDLNSVKVSYGETVTLRCIAKGEPAPVISWISPTNRVISPALDKYQVLDDGTLVVQKAQRFDGGNYTCIARNSAGHDYKTSRLEVWMTPPVINGLQGASNAFKITAVQDQTKWLDCVAKGTPTPRIMWVLPGNVVLPAPYYSSRMTVHLNGSLEIRSPKRTDSGQLVCIARNEGGEVQLLVKLDVEETAHRPPTRVPKTNSQSLTIGNTMTLNCSFESRVKPQITWILPDGTPLQSGARFSKFFHRLDGSLIISNPSVAETGMYRCLGQNFGRLVEQIFTLSPGRRPEIKNRYNSPISVMNGETLLLHCQTAVEPIRMTWTLPSGVVLNRPQRAGRYAIMPNGTLTIQQVSVYDRGSYVCRAANEYGSSALSLSVIVIAYPPRITSGPPSVTYAKRGVAVQLNCLATGIPKADVAWETPDKMRLVVTAQPRLFGNKYLHPQGSLIIQNPTQRDAGVYRCTARNAIGTDSKTTFLNVF